MAFSPTNTPTMPFQPQAARANITAATTETVIYTAGANGSKIMGVVAASTDTSNQNVVLQIHNTSTYYPLMVKQVPLGSGTSVGVAAVNMLDPALIPGLPIDDDGNPFIYLISGDTLTAEALALTSTKIITIHAWGFDF